MLLENPPKTSTSEPDQMGICLNSLDSEPKTRVHEKYVRDLLFADVRPLQLTHGRTFSGFWTAFQKLVDTLNLPSAWKKQKVNVYKACVISTLLYGSESWTMCAHQEKRLNGFHMRYLRGILGIT